MKSPLPAHKIALLGRAPVTVKPTESDKAYAAGFFDGEGNVCIARNQQGGKAKKYYVYNMRVGASQCSPEPLIWLRDRWGGSIGRTGNGLCLEWRSFANMACAFLIDVLPHLQVKRARAMLAIKFQNLVFQPGRRAHSAQHKAEQAAMKEEMNRLNLPTSSNGVLV